MLEAWVAEMVGGPLKWTALGLISHLSSEVSIWVGASKAKGLLERQQVTRSIGTSFDSTSSHVEQRDNMASQMRRLEEEDGPPNHMNEKKRSDTKDHPLGQRFMNFSEADELLKLAAVHQKVQPSIGMLRRRLTMIDGLPQQSKAASGP